MGRDDRGFSIIETLVAMGIVTLVLFPVARGTVVAGSASSLAHEHSVATGLISGDVAQLEAVPFLSLESGVNPSATFNGVTQQTALCADSHVTCTTSDGTTTFTLSSTGATIPSSNTSTSQAPIVPYVSSVTDGIKYQVATYPTVSSSLPGLVTVVIVVTWNAPTGGTATATGETEIALP